MPKHGEFCIDPYCHLVICPVSNLQNIIFSYEEKFVDNELISKALANQPMQTINDNNMIYIDGDGYRQKSVTK